MQKSIGQEWDLVIQPKVSLFDINFKEIWEYRDLLLILIRRDFVSFYKQTIFGPIWFFVQPVFTTITFTFVFGNLASISTDGLPKPLFYLCGIVCWNYFADCLSKTSTVFSDNAGVFGKVYFPRLIIPISIVASNLVKFLVQFVLFLIGIMFYKLFGANFEPNYLLIILFPCLVMMMALFGLGLGMIISSLTTKYRDLTFVISFGIQLLMYGTTVIYPLSSAPEKYKWLILINPMTSIIEYARYIFLGVGFFSGYDFVQSVLIVLAIAFTGIFFFNKVEKNFIDTI
jgi:lipopolysaccharide transport system permease protein